MAKLTDQFKRFYFSARKWQETCANDGMASLTVYPSGRTEYSYGAAPYGEHAKSAFMSAKRSVHFHQSFKRKPR